MQIHIEEPESKGTRLFLIIGIIGCVVSSISTIISYFSESKHNAFTYISKEEVIQEDIRNRERVDSILNFKEAATVDNHTYSEETEYDEFDLR